MTMILFYFGFLLLTLLWLLTGLLIMPVPIGEPNDGLLFRLLEVWFIRPVCPVPTCIPPEGLLLLWLNEDPVGKSCCFTIGRLTWKSFGLNVMFLGRMLLLIWIGVLLPVLKSEWKSLSSSEGFLGFTILLKRLAAPSVARITAAEVRKDPS